MQLYGFAALLLALAITASGAQSARDAKTWALVVGISKYQKLPGGQQLQFADKDAALFADTIQKRGVDAQNVKLLIGAEATAAAIKSAIGNWLARSASESDTVVIYFSGHGFFEREYGEAYLLGYDSDPRDPYGTALSIAELGQALNRRVRSGRVLVIADAVRRDFFDPETDPESAKSFEQAFDQLTASRAGAAAIVGSGPGEFAREGQRWGGHGVFTRHLADVLLDGADRNGNVAVVAGELFDLLKSRIAADTSAKQHAWRSGAADTQAAARVVARSEPVVTTTPQTVVEQRRPADKTSTPEVMSRAEPKHDVASDKPVIPGDTTKKAPDSKPSRSTEADANSSRPVTRSTRAVNAPSIAEKKTVPPSTAAGKKPESVSNEKKTEPKAVADNSRGESTVPAGRTGGPEVNSTAVKTPAPTSTPSESNTVQPVPAKPAPKRSTTPPGTESIRATNPSGSSGELARAEIAAAEIPTAPRPTIVPPSAVAVPSDRGVARPETIPSSVPAVRPDAAPTPLILQLEAAIASKNLIEPRNASAWDFYQRLAADPAAAADAARLKPALANALASQGRAVVSGDIRGDNIGEKVDDFKRAGQMLLRARTLAPENQEVITLEKLSAAEALIALQFYDEAERALSQLQSTKLAAVENALGLAHQGKLDTWRAERAFKRAIEMDAKWAAPHYNLASLYRSQQNQASLEELEAAAALEPTNLTLLTALGDEHFMRQQWKQATEAFRKAVAVKPSDDALHTKLGHALYSQGLQEEANREYQKARELRVKQP